ncbi:MAG: lysophospholipid acyltransferase family protein [Gemmataceae bacterium]
MPLRIATALLLPLTAFAFGALRAMNQLLFEWQVVCAGAAFAFVGVRYWHPYRGLGLAAFALFGTFLVSLAAAASGSWEWPMAFAAVGLSVAFTRLAIFFDHSRSGRRPGVGILVGTLCVIGILGGASILTFGEYRGLGRWVLPHHFLWMPIITGILTLFAVAAFFRPAFEFACEPLLWLMYRVRASGPGVSQIPQRGPCIVIANHACWFDPLFLVKVLPRPITAMMISRFYDLPVLRPLLRHVFHTIRVPDHHYKKEETPEEIREAIAALDRGECLVLFPEGFLQRTEERLLRRFGRGIWQILAARPDTPVFCCWIEGAWGSYTSYFNGPPTKNKRRDFRRPIRVAVPSPIVVDRETLSHHLATRFLLMNQTLESRKLLDLPAAPPYELPACNEEPGS